MASAVKKLANSASKVASKAVSPNMMNRKKTTKSDPVVGMINRATGRMGMPPKKPMTGGGGGGIERKNGR